MTQYTITLTEAQDKAIKAHIPSIQNFIENFVFERCRIAVEEIVSAEIERKLAAGEAITGTKEDIVLAADIEPASVRVAREQEEYVARRAAEAANQPQE